MKKRLYSAVAFICIFMLGLSLVPLSAYAFEDLSDVLIPESMLSNFAEKEEIEALAAEIADMANCFEEDGFHAEVSDVDFSKAYCVFTEAYILSELPETMEDLKKLLSSASMVWNIPVYSNGQTVLVQVSRALELSEIELDDCTEEEIERLKERAGKWDTVSCSMYEDNEIPEEGIKQILSANHKNVEQSKCVLIGGEVQIRTLLAVIIENDTVSGAVSLERSVSYTSDEPVQKKKAARAETVKTNAVGSEDKVTLQENQMYSLDEFAKVAAQAKEGSSLDIGMGSTPSANAEKGSAIGYYIAGGAVVLGIIIVIGISIRRRLINKQ